MSERNSSKFVVKKATYVVDVRLPPNVNAAVPIVRPYAVIVVFDHVRAVASLTICDLDFQRSADIRYTPIIRHAPRPPALNNETRQYDFI